MRAIRCTARSASVAQIPALRGCDSRNMPAHDSPAYAVAASAHDSPCARPMYATSPSGAMNDAEASIARRKCSRAAAGASPPSTCSARASPATDIAW